MTNWQEIEEARARAHAKHGDDSIEGLDASDPRWLAILVEEGGETSEANLLAWNALLQARIGRVAHEQTYDATGSLRGELVDVLAVASAWLDALDDAPLHREPAADPVCGREWHALPSDPDAEVCECQRLPNHKGDHVCPACSILHADGRLTVIDGLRSHG